MESLEPFDIVMEVTSLQRELQQKQEEGQGLDVDISEG